MTAVDARAAAARVALLETVAPDSVTLGNSLKAACGWTDDSFDRDGAAPPYLRIGTKFRIASLDLEPCFSSARRDYLVWRAKISIADHLSRYAAIMVDPLAFEECFGPGEGVEARFPFGAWLTIRRVTFEGLHLWGLRQGEVILPLNVLTVASEIWLRSHPTS